MRPQHVFFALVGLLAVIGYFLTWGEWKGPLPPGMGPPEGWRRATLPATYAIDLETGAVKDSGESARDLWWEAKNQDEFCLCPYRLNNGDVLMAPVPVAELAALGADRAATLQYSAKGFELHIQERELASGLAFAVRTGTGNFAKARVVKIRANKSLTLEWRMLGPATVAREAARNPSLESRRLLVEVRTNLRGGKNRERAAELLGEVLPLADQYAATSFERIEFLNEVGQLYWSAQRPDTALAVISRAATEIALHDAAPDARPLAWKVRQQTYWWLGVLNRDAGRLAEAVPWLEKSLAVARAGMTTDHNEEGLRRMSITSPLKELYQLECRRGNKVAAANRLRELQDTCVAMLPDSRSHGACRTEQLRC